MATMKVQGVLLDFLKRLDKRFKILLASIGMQTWASGLSAQYNQLYATFLGARPIDLGLLEGVGGIASAIFSAPAGWLIDKFGAKRMLMFGLTLLVIVASLYGCALSWLMLIPAMILMRISMWLTTPLADMIIVDITDFKNRALTMGVSRMIWFIPNLFAPSIAAIIISLLGGISASSIRPLYFIQIIATLLALSLISAKLEYVPRWRSISLRFDLIQSYKELVRSERWLKHWIIIMALMRLWYVSTPYIPLWIVRVKGGDQNLLGLMGTLSILAAILLQVPMGRLADTIGRKKTFLILRFFIYAGILLLAWAPSHAIIVIAGILGVSALGASPGIIGVSGVGSISFVPFITMFFESFAPERRGRVQGIIGLFDFISSLASLLGGFLWDLGYMHLVLILPLLTDSLLLLPILMRIPENPNK